MSRSFVGGKTPKARKGFSYSKPPHGRKRGHNANTKGPKNGKKES